MVTKYDHERPLTVIRPPTDGRARAWLLALGLQFVEVKLALLKMRVSHEAVVHFVAF
jgi:hypothetical protein